MPCSPLYCKGCSDAPLHSDGKASPAAAQPRSPRPAGPGAGGSAEHGGPGGGGRAAARRGLTSAGGGASPRVSLLGASLPAAAILRCPVPGCSRGGRLGGAGAHGVSRRGQPRLRRPPALLEVSGATGEPAPAPPGAAPPPRAARPAEPRGRSVAGGSGVCGEGRERPARGREKLLHGWGPTKSARRRRGGTRFFLHGAAPVRAEGGGCWEGNCGFPWHWPGAISS